MTSLSDEFSNRSLTRRYAVTSVGVESVALKPVHGGLLAEAVGDVEPDVLAVGDPRGGAEQGAVVPGRRGRPAGHERRGAGHRLEREDGDAVLVGGGQQLRDRQGARRRGGRGGGRVRFGGCPVLLG